MEPHTPISHHWYTPADCAALLGAVQRGGGYRGACPVHGGDNPTALSIYERLDQYGHPATYITCFTHKCDILDICAYMGIELRNLFAMPPEHSKTFQHLPRVRRPWIDRLKTVDAPTADVIAQILLEEMIVSDPPFLQECYPARKKMWELAQASPTSKAALTKALHAAKLVPALFWDSLATEMEV
jgi:hypothetical protein